MEQAAGSTIRDPLIGTVLDERYRVLRRIGRGGMGIVYLAQHVLIGRKYAIKTLSERTHATEEMVARFHREALAAAAVGSQHVVEVTDMGRLPDGTLYIALEYLEGVELASAVRAEGPFGVGRAVHVACQLCEALAAVHEKGIVHRDLKPENLFLIAQRGDPDFLKVLDFGICKLLEGADPSDPDQPALTRTNASLGTPQYMAPEQFQTSARVDQRADIHAVGAILYFMLTGKPPFDAPTVAQLYMRICVEPPPPLSARRPDVPLELEQIIRRALCKHPDDRFDSSALLRAALLPFASSLEQRSSERSVRTLVEAGAPTFSVSSETTRQPTPAALETAPASQLAVITPLLPERRWQRPLLALSLLIGVMGSMGFGAWALAPGQAPRRAQPTARSAPAQIAAPPMKLEMPLPSEAPTAPSPVLESAAQAARPRLNKTQPAPKLEAVPATPSSEPVAPADVPLPAQAADEASDASFVFPRRALKRVF